ncbi:MAG: molecular chaperone HscB [Saprospiraceae bacterium]|jgi:molecular chaperone HscB
MQDYFDFFAIKRRFKIDRKALRLKYISNSRAYHPDFFTMEDGDKQEEVLRLSTLNNKAYQVLFEERKRMQHLLSLYDMFPEEGQSQVPQEFLMDMMEVNEQLLDAQMSEDQKAISGVINELEAINADLASVANKAMTDWDENQDKNKLTEIKDIYLKQQYLRRLQDRLKGVDPEF